MDCSRCTAPEAIRRHWHCGWIKKSEHSEDGVIPVPPEFDGERPDVCPGYLVQLPQVIEAARAHGWRKDGALRDFYDGEPLTPLAKLSIDIIGGALREVEQHRIRKSQNGGE